ncbi:GNAT family N-acetyltransferase [Amedibacillus sp. YH-ame10]
MNFITITQDTIETEHICCAIADKPKENCVASKKAWLKQRIEEGLVFTKLNERAKVFIEYIPAEYAWAPIDADKYMHINCFWVSGQYKGQGYANALLESCIKDAKEKGKDGLTVIASEKKRPYLSDAQYLKHKGFLPIDSANPFFVLYYLPFHKDAKAPKFKASAKKEEIEDKNIVLYYTNQCPHTAKYVPLIEEVAKRYHAPLTVHKIETREDAQEAPIPSTTYALFYQGKYVTNEIMSEKKFENYLKEIGYTCS